MLELIRPAGVGVAVFLGYWLGEDPVARFHIMGPLSCMIMAGTVAYESIMTGERAPSKTGYQPDRAYQIQSGLANAAMAITAALVWLCGWGPFAEAAIVTVVLLFFSLSAANHLRTAILFHNMKPVNLLRPLVTLLLLGALIPPMLQALSRAGR